jgi:hypothetical protein
MIHSDHGYVLDNEILIFSYGPRSKITLWAVKEEHGWWTFRLFASLAPYLHRTTPRHEQQ